MAQYDNLAYDFSRFDREVRQRKQTETSYNAAAKKTIQADFTPKTVTKTSIKTQICEIRGTNTSISRLRMTKIAKAFVTCIVLMLMFGVVVYNQAKLNEINREITNATAQIAQLKTDYQQKSRELEQRVNIRTAEDVAKNEYGMTGVGSDQINYIILPGEESQTGVRSENGIFASIGRFFTQIASYISGN